MKYFFWLSLLLLIFVRFITTRPNFKVGETLKIKGNLLSEPTSSFDKYYFKIQGINIELKTNESLHYGDYIVVKGFFDGKKLSKSELESKKENRNIFSDIRTSVVDYFKSALKEPLSSLVSGITIGAKSSLPANFKDRLNEKGLSHIVVASGTNITILAVFISSLLIKKVNRKHTIILTIIVIWIYTLITGFEAPIIRASIMASIAFSGVLLGKIVNTLKVTLLTGSIMLIIFPLWLTDVGFILSFSVTLSLVLFQKKISFIFRKFPEIIKDDLSTSFAAQIGSIPVIYFFFDKVNWLSPFYNILVLWTVPVIMFFGGLSALFSFIYRPISNIILIPLIPILTYFIGIVNM